MKKILISGITGQDGSYMSEYCLNLGHEVYGIVRRTSQINNKNFKHLCGNTNFKVVYGDLLDDPRNILEVCSSCNTSHAHPDLIHWGELEFCQALGIDPRSKINKKT